MSFGNNFLQKSEGGIKLLIDRHAIPMRLDYQRRVFFLSDPNFGPQHFRLQPKPGQTMADANNDPEVVRAAFNRTIDCFLELVEWCYPETDAIIGAQLQKREPGEVVDETSYQLKDEQLFA